MFAISSHYLAEEHKALRPAEYFGASLSRIPGELHVTGALPPAAVPAISSNSVKLSKNI